MESVKAVLAGLETEDLAVETFPEYVRAVQVETQVDGLRQECVRLGVDPGHAVALRISAVTNRVYEAKSRFEARQEQPEPEQAVAEEVDSAPAPTLAALRELLFASMPRAPKMEKSLYHDHAQEALVDDLSSLVSALKRLAQQFQQELVADSEILQSTVSSLDKNWEQMGRVNRLLGEYAGADGKVGFWWLLKVCLFIVCAFVGCVMMIGLLRA